MTSQTRRNRHPSNRTLVDADTVSHFIILDMHTADCAGCGQSIGDPDDCRIVVYHNERGSIRDAGLLCPAC